MKEIIDIAIRYPLLTQQQEIELGRRIQAWLRTPSPTPGQIRSGKRARDQFVCCNLRLVITIAKRYARFIAGTGVTLPDIIQEGVIGLQRAAEKYDPECGYKMSTYAYWWIRQAITRSIEMRVGMIHIPSGAKKKLCKFRDAAADGGSISEILERAGLKQRDMHYIEQASICYQVGNLDEMDLRSI